MVALTLSAGNVQYMGLHKLILAKIVPGTQWVNCAMLQIKLSYVLLLSAFGVSTSQLKKY